MVVPRKITNDKVSLSVRRREEKRVRKPVHPSIRTLESLPKDLLVDVFARVASSSFIDLFNVKLSCKDFNQSTRDDYIFQHISIDKFPFTNWNRPSERVISFLTHCLNKGNSESLFRQGMMNYFVRANIESGLEYLRIAAEKRHLDAIYVYGMILLSSRDQLLSQQGLNILKYTMVHTSSRLWNVQDSRDKVRSILRQIWINNPIMIDEVKTKCQEPDHDIRLRRRGWSLDEDEEISSCATCLWYRELIYFCEMMNVMV
ncbi:hypothetical protein SSX86_023234 [Deinandra increscens subsp. villosa]|uniref:F-box domain-containing protein n=1 Tax=Deinandra increscens subsp. villosa TaxID=3103831 RepID=A0AAP0GRX5_9ASTR